MSSPTSSLFFPSVFRSLPNATTRLARRLAMPSNPPGSFPPESSTHHFDELSQTIPRTGISDLPTEVLEKIISCALALSSPGIFLSSPAQSTSYAQISIAFKQRKRTFGRLALVNKTWETLAKRQISKAIHYKPSETKDGDMELVEVLEEETDWAARIEELVLDLHESFAMATAAPWLHHTYGAHNPSLELQRYSALALLACPSVNKVSIYRRRKRSPRPSTLAISYLAPIDQNLVDAIITRPLLTSLALHPASSIDLQILSMCNGLKSLEVGIDHDMTNEVPAWATDGTATPRTRAPAFRLESLTLVFDSNGLIRSSDLVRLLGADPRSIKYLEIRFNESDARVVSRLSALTEMILSRCIGVTELVLGDISPWPSDELGSALARCQDQFLALPKLERLTLSRLAFYPDQFVLVCDTLLSQLDISLHSSYSTTPSNQSIADMFSLLDADGTPGDALRGTIDRLGPVPVRIRVDDAGMWNLGMRRAVMDRCMRLGVALDVSWEGTGGGRSPKAKERMLAGWTH